MFELMSHESAPIVIKVIGIGGAGCNMVHAMKQRNLEGVDFVLVDTDISSLQSYDIEEKLLLSANNSQSVTASLTPEQISELAADNGARIKSLLGEADLVFVVASMDGATGSTLAPIVAGIAKQMDVLTLSLVARTLHLEDDAHLDGGNDGVLKLLEKSDALFVVPTEALCKDNEEQAHLRNMFEEINAEFARIFECVVDLVIRPGLINVDFADIRTVLAGTGFAVSFEGRAIGKSRASEATESVVHKVISSRTDIALAQRILVNVTAGPDFTLDEFNVVWDVIEQHASKTATVLVGTVVDKQLIGELRVGIIVTGFKRSHSGVNAGIPGLAALASGSSTISNDQSEDIGDLDIPAFLRRKADTDAISDPSADYQITKNLQTIKIVAPHSVNEVEIAEIIAHLSNVYRSVGGDELVLNSVRDLPPDTLDRVAKLASGSGSR